MFKIPQINYNFTEKTRILIFAPIKMGKDFVVSPDKIVITENFRKTKNYFIKMGFQYSGELKPQNVFFNHFYLSEGVEKGCITVN